MPGGFYDAWLENTGLGQPRSNVLNDTSLGPYVQYFRYGYILSDTFGGTPREDPIPLPDTPCGGPGPPPVGGMIELPDISGAPLEAR